jgi:hypothetical protein
VKNVVNRGFLNEDDTWQNKHFVPGATDLRSYLLEGN